MKEGGWALIGLGVLLLIIGVLAIDVSRDVGYIPPGNPYLPSTQSSVANLHAMHIQGLLVHGGIGAIIGGILLTGFAILDERLAGLSGRPNGEEPQADTSLQSHAETASSSTSDTTAYDEPDSSSATAGTLIFIIACALIIFIVAGYASMSRDDAATAGDVMYDNHATDMGMDMNMDMSPNALESIEAEAGRLERGK